MSYLVLARKWRPQLFADLVGQEHVSRTLANSITSGRIHHAFLFTGARGVGKTSAARILAKALNCENPVGTEPCNSCSSCIDITAGKCVDVFEIDGASNNGVDDVRELRDTLRYLPARARYKVFIIDEVHMLSINAFNALLKTLEEPPDHVKFIFATTEPHKIPVTILSRCQRFDFRKIAVVKVAAQLRRIVDAEKIDISEKALVLIAQRGGGSMRDCLSTLDQVVAFCGETVADIDVQSLLGVVDQRLLCDILTACMQQNCSMILEIIRNVDDLGHSFRQFSQELIELVRRVILCGVVKDPQADLGLFADELQVLEQLQTLAVQEDWQRLLSMLIKTETELASSVYPKLLVEMALIRAASLPPSRNIADLINKIESMDGVVAQAGQRAASQPAKAVQAVEPVAAPAEVVLAAPEVQSPSVVVNQEPSPLPEIEPPIVVAPDPVPPGGEVSTGDVPMVAEEISTLAPSATPSAPVVSAPANQSVDQQWLQFVQFAKKHRPRIGSLLEHGSVLSLEMPLLRVGFEGGSFMLQQLSDSETKERLHDLAKQFFKQDVTVKVEPLSMKAAAPLSLVAAEEKRESDRGRRLREDALSHPMVKKAVEIFSGEIAKITPIDKGFV